MSTNDVEKSFDKLLKDLPELALDTPRAPQVCKILWVHSSFVHSHLAFIELIPAPRKFYWAERGKTGLFPITQQQCSNIFNVFFIGFFPLPSVVLIPVILYATFSTMVSVVFWSYFFCYLCILCRVVELFHDLGSFKNVDCYN